MEGPVGEDDRPDLRKRKDEVTQEDEAQQLNEDQQDGVGPAQAA